MCRNHEVNSQLNNRVSALRHGKHTTEFVASYLIVFPLVFVSFPDFIRNVENIHARKFLDVRYDGADPFFLRSLRLYENRMQMDSRKYILS